MIIYIWLYIYDYIYMIIYIYMILHIHNYIYMIIYIWLYIYIYMLIYIWLYIYDYIYMIIYMILYVYMIIYIYMMNICVYIYCFLQQQERETPFRGCKWHPVARSQALSRSNKFSKFLQWSMALHLRVHKSINALGGWRDRNNKNLKCQCQQRSTK